MKIVLMAASALAMASPALAQTTTTTTPPATMGTPSSTDTMTSGPMTSAPATSAPAAIEPAAASQDPKAIIASEFPTYDKDGNGALSRAEFDLWMVALKSKSGEAAMKPADQSAWLKSSFTTADSNKDKAVSLTELTGYLTAKG